jgi:hypothetical protein
MMRRPWVYSIAAVLVILGTALASGLFWWLVLSEEPKPITATQAPRRASAVGGADERTAGTSSSALPELKYKPSHPWFHVEPYLQYPTQTAISILWETTHELPGVVEYGETEELGQMVSESGPERTLHEVRLTGLKPATRYYYRVRSGEAVSPVYTFRTAPPPGASDWRIAVYGDSRSNPAVHRAIAEQIARQRVDLVVHTGDMVANGRNHDSWAREFFAPLAPLACQVPIIGVPGNHEGDSPWYFSYFALPGNERYYLFEYGNARFVCLDSNVREGKAPWAREQERWFIEQLRQLDDRTWNFVVFHQPLFSAHESRPISPLRWQWTPVLLDPLHPIHGVFNGHDHFYARTWPIGLYQGEKSSGVIFVTTAGGGAPLYRLRRRSYVAQAVPVHHFTILECHGDELKVTAYTTTGKPLDRFTVKKGVSPTEFYCWESEWLRESLRRVLSEAPSLPVSPGQTRLQSELVVPHTFRVPMQARLQWYTPPGWRVASEPQKVPLLPGEPLRIPLQAEVRPEATHLLPRLQIELYPSNQRPASTDAEQASSSAAPFRNHVITLYPFKLAGPDKYALARVSRIEVNGRADDPDWQHASPIRIPRIGYGSLLSSAGVWSAFSPPGFGPTAAQRGSGPGQGSSDGAGAEGLPVLAAESPPEVRLATNNDQLFVLVRVQDSQQRIRVKPPDPHQSGSALALYDTHVRLELYNGEHLLSYAVSAENISYHTVGGKPSEASWVGVCDRDGEWWITEMGIPLGAMAKTRKWRANVVVFLKAGSVQYEWRSDRPATADTELLPTWDLRNPSSPQRFAELIWPP